MTWGMRLMLENSDSGAVPRNLCSFGGQTCDETKQIQRDILGELRRQHLGHSGLPVRGRQQIPIDAAQRAVP